MDTAKVANWLQILGNFGIVVGLILVAVQINQNSEQIQQTASLSRAEAARELFFIRINNEQLGSTYEKLTAAGLDAATSNPFFAKLMKEADLTVREAGMLWDEQYAWWLFYEQMILNMDRMRTGQRTAVHFGLRSAYEGTKWRAFWYQSMKPYLNPEEVAE